MSNQIVRVVQCWDDGPTSDIRLTEILRRYGAMATFNLNAEPYDQTRKSAFSGWKYKGTEVWCLGLNEIKYVYDGFLIGNHTLTHQRLDKIPIETAYREIMDGRKRLQDFFSQAVYGFVYPSGYYNETVMTMVKEAGHLYARTTISRGQ